jgi:prolyl-tRNA synthetase
MLDVYTDFAVNDAAIPVVRGRKSNQEKFAGADASYTIEAMMKNTWALQSGTSHNLGQNFAKAFDIKYLDANNEQQFCWTTSWGLSTRMVGAIIMTHGDDKGLRLPPRLAPIQVVAVPIFKTEDERSKVLNVLWNICETLLTVGIRVHVDERDGMTPGFKFNDWEMRGVPIRLDLGPRDLEGGTVTLARRDVPGKEGKTFVKQNELVPALTKLLAEIQVSMLREATEFRDAHIFRVHSYDELKKVIEDGWAALWHCGTRECEDKIKDETKASSRCFPLDVNERESAEGQICEVCGKSAQGIAYFGRAY